MSTVIIKCCKSNKTLTFTIAERLQEEIVFVAEINGGQFNGSIQTTTYHNGPPSSFFSELANDWRGWKGTKSWCSIDQDLFLDAITDGLGHIKVSVRMRGSPCYDDSLQVIIWLEAGQLDQIARAVQKFFD